MRKNLQLTLSCVLCLLILYWGAFGAFASLQQRPLFVLLVVLLGILMFPLWKNTRRQHIGAVIDTVLAITTALACVRIIRSADDIMTSLPFASVTDIWLCLLLVAAILEISRRAVGLVFPLIVIVTLGYARFGAHLPGALQHRGFDTSFIVETLYLGDLGLWGLLSGIAAGVIAAFTLLGAVLLRAGGAEVMIGVATRISGGSVGGGAKTATIASGLFGMISGSSVANVATTGNFTIPLMKRLGYPAPFAAAVEAVASTGGQLAPPIMGAAAFIMAEIIGVDYLTIAAAAALPALLFYGGVLTSIHRKALRLGLQPLPPEQIPSWRKALNFGKGVLSIALALGGLIGGLIAGKSLQTSAFFGIVGALIGYLLQSAGDSGRDRIEMLRNIVCEATRGVVTIGILLACAQILVAMINLTGIGVSLSGAIVEMADGNLLWVAPLVAVVCLIIGMGIPTTAAYVLVAAVMAPALIRSGVEPLIGHLYVFYYATLSVITPPMCIAIFVAAGIAKERWTPVAAHALRLGAVTYVIPALFLIYPGLLIIGKIGDIAISILAGVVLVISMTMVFGNATITGNRRVDTVIWLTPALITLSGIPIALVASITLLTVTLIFYRKQLSKKG